MAFLEEITRHRLLHGVIPIEQLPTQEQLDALLAAYTAWLAIKKPDEVTQLGNKQEGFITLPAGTLLEQYLVI
jgi:predicted RNase H-like nuclease